MRDAVVMWREPRMVVLTAVCAAVYAAAMIPFKFLIVFPGLAEVRPAAVLPIVFSLLFGPAGAFGAAFGNVVGDVLGGMFGLGSIFGFIGNFAYGYLPYKLWEAWMGGQSPAEIEGWRERIPEWMLSPKNDAAAFGALFLIFLIGGGAGQAAGLWDMTGLAGWKAGGVAVPLILLSLVGAALILSAVVLVYSPLKLVAIIFISCMGCAGPIGWGIELLGFFPFKVLGLWVLGNNFFISFILAPPLLLLLSPRVKARYLTYADLLGERTVRPRTALLGRVLVIGSLIGLFAAGIFLGPEQVADVFHRGGDLWKSLLISPFFAFFLLGLFML